MKKYYEKIELEIIKFSLSEGVLTASKEPAFSTDEYGDIVTVPDWW